MKKLIVDKKYNNKKLNRFLKDTFPRLSDNLFYKTLRKKDIKVNGKRVSENTVLKENDEVLVYIADDLLEEKFDLNVVFEDDNILLVNKPQGIEVTGSQSLTEFIHKKYAVSKFLPMPCHRLDRNTFGLVLFAKNEDALLILLDAFKNHKIEKHYLALVYGIPKVKKQKMEAYLFKDSKKKMVYISDSFKKGYLKIITSFTLLKRYQNDTSLLDVEIETGRTHQIRAHLAHIGLPIIGDGKYGINEINKKMGAKFQKLCSYRIVFHFDEENLLSYLDNKEFKIKVSF